LDQYGVTFSGSHPSFPYPSGAVKLKKPEGYIWTGSKAQRERPGLFGADQITTSDSSQLFIVEGESDALAFAEAGISAVSLPAGAGSVKERDIKALKALKFQDHVILYDRDIYGLKGSHKLREWMEASGLTATLLSYPPENVTAYDGVMAWNEADRKPELFQKVLDNLPEAPPIPEEWPDIIHPLEATPTPIPLDALTPVLRNVVSGLASSLQVPADFIAVLALCAVSGAVGGKFSMRISSSWIREWSVLFGVAILKSGERKSPAFHVMARPIKNWVADQMKTKESAYRMAKVDLEVAEKQSEKLKTLLASGHTKNKNFKKDLDLELEDSINNEIKFRDAMPASASILVGDITSPELVERAEETGGRVSQLTPEGVVLRLIDGKHNDGTTDAEFHKMAYDGESYLRDRVGKHKKTVSVPVPALTMCCAAQPAVLSDLKNKDMLTAEGILARCCFVQPPSLVGTRDPKDQIPLSDEDYLAYEMSIQRLLEVEYRKDQEPPEVTFTEEAVEELIAFVWEVEQQLHPLRSLASIPEWALKQGGRVVRISSFQTMVARALDEETKSDADIFKPIEVEAVRDAIRIGRALATHARYTLVNMGLNRHTMLLQYVLAKRIELGPNATVLELMRACRKFQTKDELEPLLEELEQIGYLKIQPVASTGGRPPSPKVLVNPDYLRAECAKSPTEETSRTFSTDEGASYEEIERLAIQQESDDDLPF
tara:strand:+ start:3561 stop:5708 length:2148 start_codon:yes stop_codon:yes gene_type:complete